MVAVSTISWEEVASPTFGDPQRQAFRQAVAEVADKAKLTLPECNGRVDAAVKLVLAGDVAVLDGGLVRVASGSAAPTTYLVDAATCQCKDFPQAPSGWCKHRIAAGLMKRAVGRADALLSGEVVEDAAPEPPAAPLALPEAPASANCHVTIGGRQVQVTLRDTDESRLLARLTALLAQYPVEQVPAAMSTTPSASAQQPTPEGFCLIHQVQMPLNANARGKWYSHKREDGSWCKGK